MPAHFPITKGPVFKTGPFVRKRFNTALEQTILGISHCLGAVLKRFLTKGPVFKTGPFVIGKRAGMRAFLVRV